MSVGAFKPVSAGGPPSRPTVSVRSCGLLVLRPLSLAPPCPGRVKLLVWGPLFSRQLA